MKIKRNLKVPTGNTLVGEGKNGTQFFKELKDIPDGSVDLILTDPPFTMIKSALTTTIKWYDA